MKEKKIIENFNIEELEERLEMNSGDVTVGGKVGTNSNGPYGEVSVSWKL